MKHLLLMSSLTLIRKHCLKNFVKHLKLIIIDDYTTFNPFIPEEYSVRHYSLLPEGGHNDLSDIMDDIEDILPF